MSSLPYTSTHELDELPESHRADLTVSGTEQDEGGVLMVTNADFVAAVFPSVPAAPIVAEAGNDRRVARSCTASLVYSPESLFSEGWNLTLSPNWKNQDRVRAALAAQVEGGAKPLARLRGGGQKMSLQKKAPEGLENHNTNEQQSKEQWHTHRVMTFSGSLDTHIHSGNDYAAITLQELFDTASRPSAVPKAQAPAFIPSSYCKHDGRVHQEQREQGSFVTINGDIDEGNHDFETICKAVDEFFGDVASLIYSSSGATPENRKWRIVAPLEIPLDFIFWCELCEAFYTFMESSGIKMDWSLARAAQPVFLPNVPSEKRGKNGIPLFYEHGRTDGLGASPDSPVAAQWIKKVREQHTATELKKAMAREVASLVMKKRGNSGGVIGAFNQSHSIVEMFEANGYECCPRNDDDWRSPYQSSGSYATRIFEGYWVSLSASDAVSHLGAASASGCQFGDAFDIFNHFSHGGDVKAAVKAAASDPKVAQLLLEAQQGPQEASGADPVFLDWQTLPDEPPDVPFIIPGWMPDNVVTLFSAHGGTGKSYMSLFVSLCLATGKHPFEKEESLPRVKVVLYSAEDSLAVMQSRLMRYMKYLRITAVDLDGWLLVLDATDCDNVLFTGDEKIGGRTTARFKWLGKQVATFGAGLLIFDNASDAFDANENDRGKVRQFMSSLKRLAPAVLLLAHVDAASSMVTDTSTAKGYSGSTGWHNSARSRWFMVREKNGDIVLRLPKVNYALAGSEAVIRWDADVGVFLVVEVLSGAQKPADHRAVLLGLLAAVLDAGETVSAASNTTNSVFNKIKELPGFPPRLKSGEVAREVGAWKLAGFIKAEDYTRSNRSQGTRLVLTDAGRALAHRVQTQSIFHGLPMPTTAHANAHTLP